MVFFVKRIKSFLDYIIQKTNDFKNSICVCYFTEKRKIW